MYQHSLNKDIKALTFDVFGTCVDWRKSVTKELHNACQNAVSNPANREQVALDEAKSMTTEDWADIAQEWRTTYYEFTKAFIANPGKVFKTVDEHHHDALLDILAMHGMRGLWTEAEIQHLALVWHRLDSWSDTNAALEILGKHYQTATLSNGNLVLLQNMQKHSGMKFTHTFSGETFGTYKPDPRTYHGAAERMSVKPEQVAMVAAHLGDLKAAKGCGLQTVFVERAQEDFSDFEKEKKDGYVDLWIGLNDGGFEGITKVLGLS